jgi:uncharacterized RDD family membrane protein YckC
MNLQPDPTAHPNPSMPSASLLRRMSCWFYEGLLLFGVIFIAGYLFGTLTQTRHAMNNRLGLQAFVFLVLALYFSFFWHKGQTLAMKTWHLKITNLNGHALSRPQALLRYVLAWIWFVPPLVLTWLQNGSSLQGLGVVCVWVVFWALLSKLHPDKQFWHDAWSKTRVVDTRQKSSSNLFPSSP